MKKRTKAKPEAAPAVVEEVTLEAALSENTDVASDVVEVQVDADIEATVEVEAATVDPNADVIAEVETVVEAAAEGASEENAAPKITDEGEILSALEAVIFASPKAITLVKLRNLLNSFNYDTSALPAYLEKLSARFEARGFELAKVGGGYQFRTHPKNSDLLQKLLEDRPARLSPSALEALAIVAYKQPVTRAEIDAVRGIDSGHLMRGLLEKNLIRTDGHAETPGRPLLYATTPYFLEVFSLNSLDDLPALEEFNRELVKADSGAEMNEGVVLAADPDALAEAAAFHGGVSPLAAEPDRGSFDAPDEEAVHNADFGLAERALENPN